MTTGTGSERDDDSITQQRLFRIADGQKQLESIVHSPAIVVVAIVIGDLFISIGLGLLDGIGLTGPVLDEVSQTVFHFTGMFLVGLGYLHWRRDTPLVVARIPTRRDGLFILGGALTLIAVIVGLDFILSRVGLEPAENVAVETGREHPELFLYYIPIVLLLNAPAEELLFRGVIQGLFRRAYGVIPGVLAASALFGVVHYIALVGEGSVLVYVLIAFISGIILGLLYEFTENLLVPTVVHAIWNCLVYLSLYAETTGLL